jgi:hypothetical protein
MTISKAGKDIVEGFLGMSPAQQAAYLGRLSEEALMQLEVLTEKYLADRQGLGRCPACAYTAT